MKIIIASDKFKGSLSSNEVCNIIEPAIKSVIHDCEIIKLPLSDGGDGFAETISKYLGAEVQHVKVLDPLFKEIDSSWLIAKNGNAAFIEMAKASGLQLLKPYQYNCSITTTFGTGQLIMEAINKSVKEIIIGVGGSATNDGGIGMAAALGYKFLDSNGKELSPVGKNLIRLRNIDSTNVKPVDHIRYIVACDVNNYLCGENGATKMFARQKGATDEMINELEEGMPNYIEVVKKDMGVSLSKIKGAGAAGGLAAGCVAFLNAKIISGADLILEYSNAEKYIQQTDIIITGEGKLDKQTLEGKLVSQVCTLAKKFGKKIFIVCGISEINNLDKEKLGTENIFQLMDLAKNKNESIENASELLYNTSVYFASLIKMSTDNNN
ncbi:MAG TPA: glycerate kinase [Puia sp.]|nr:glycerate kinase [Puia sp.]